MVQEYFPVGLGALWRSLAPCKRIAPYKRTAFGRGQTWLRTREPRLEWLRVRLWLLEWHRTRGPRLEEGKLGSVREDRAWHLQSRSLCRWPVLESSLVCESCFQGHWPGRRQGHQTFLIGGGRWLALPMSSREGHGQVALFCKARWVGVKESTGGKSETQAKVMQTERMGSFNSKAMQRKEVCVISVK